jgi:hypothetical protein
MAPVVIPCIVIVLALSACNQTTGGAVASTSVPPPPGTGASAGPARASDVAYCDQLASLYERYGTPADQRGEDFTVSVAEAINQCHGGDPDSGIATLSRLLLDQDFTLPPRPKG